MRIGLSAFLFFIFVCLSSVDSFALPLKSDDVVGFEVIVAGPCKHEFQCAFGHSMIRVNMRNAPVGDDPVFAFTTDEKEPRGLSEKLSFTFRSVSGLPIVYSVFDLKTTVVNYAWKEERLLTRILLQVSEKTKAKLIENINALFFDRDLKPEDKTAYDSLVNNCAGKITDLLKESGFPYELFGIAMPGNLAAHLYRTYSALYPAIETSLNSPIEVNFKTLPESFYRYCDDGPCADSVIREFDQYWPNAKIDFPVYRVHNHSRAPRSLWTRTEPVHWNGMKPVVQTHFELLSLAR